MAEHAVELPLSPELVLVSPDLRERALIEGRDARPRRYPVPSAHEIVPLRAVGGQPRVPPVPPAVVVADAPQPEWHLTVGTATLIALTAVVLFGAGLAVGRLAIRDSTTRSVSPAAVLTTARVRDGMRATTPSAPPVVATPGPARPNPAAPPTRPGGAATAVRPIPGGGYVLPEGRGRFRLSSDGRTIVDFELATGCAGPVTLPPIEVGTTGTFAFEGHPTAASQGTTVRVSGRFVSPTEARGTAQVAGRACRSPATSFIATLS